MNNDLQKFLVIIQQDKELQQQLHKAELEGNLTPAIIRLAGEHGLNITEEEINETYSKEVDAELTDEDLEEVGGGYMGWVGFTNGPSCG